MPRRRLAMAVLIATALAGCGDKAPIRSAGPAASSSASVTSTVTVSAAPVRVINFSASPYGIEAAGDVVWVETDAGDGKSVMLRIDPRTGKRGGSVAGSSPYFDGHDLWYHSGRDVVRADPRTGRPRERFPVGHPGPTAVLPDALWVATGDESQATLQRWDRRANRVTDRIALPPGEAKYAVVAGGAVWVVIDGSDVVVKVDPVARRIMTRVPAGSRPHSAAVGFGSLWITDHGEPTLQRLDLSSARVIAKVADVAYNVGIVATPTSVWTATIDGIAEVDPATNRVKRRVSLGGTGDYYDIAVAAGSLWITSAEEMRVYYLPL